MITCDYNYTVEKANKAISPKELQDLKKIADIKISNISLEDCPNLLVFPDSFKSYDRDFEKKVICNIINDGAELHTNSIVGFIVRNKTHLSIHSRFANEDEDYFYVFASDR